MVDGRTEIEGVWCVMVYVSDGVNSMRRHDWEDEEMEVIWVQVKTRKLQVLIEMHIDHWMLQQHGWTAWL